MECYLENKTPKKVIVDASSAILLVKAHLSPHLVTAYNVILAKSVFDEITRKRLPGSDEYTQYAEQGIITIQEPHRDSCNDTTEKLPNLGQGEIDTLLLFYEGAGDFIMIDDGDAAKYFKREGIPFINALLLPGILEAAGVESRSSGDYLFAKIVNLGRYSPQIVSFAQKCSTEELRFFLP
jgi:predicted nucleic acid-binding protein